MVPLFRYVNLWVDLKKVESRCEIANAVRYDQEKLTTTIVRCSFNACTFRGAAVFHLEAELSCPYAMVPAVLRCWVGPCSLCEDYFFFFASDFVVTFSFTTTTSYTNRIPIMGNDGGSIPGRRDPVRSEPVVRQSPYIL